MQDTFFAPQLYIPAHTYDVSFYEKAFGAKVLRLFTNDDDSIHVAELQIGDALFHLHEAMPGKDTQAPAAVHTTTVSIGLFVPDVDAVITSVLSAGSTLMSAAKDYDYGYRQGQIKDPFGHKWIIQCRI